MITAAQVKILTSQTATGLSQLLEHSGYRDNVFQTAWFQGITNGGEFCYSVTFHNAESDEIDSGKVFVRYDATTGYITASF